MLGAIAREAARRFGDAPAYVAAAGWPLSYRDLDLLSDEAAAGLMARGVRAGDVVALVLPAGPEYPVAYLAAAKIGAVTAGVNVRLSARERDQVLAVARPALALAVADVAPSSGSVEIVEVASGVDDVLLPLREAGRGGPALPELADDPDRPVAIIFTSGTTGVPKGALFCDRQLMAITAADVGERWGGGGRTLVGTAVAHLGFMTKLAGNLRQGGTSYFTDRWRAEQALALTAEHGMTMVGGIPTQVALMLQVPGFESYDLSSVRAIVIGGGPATAALVREARERFRAPLMMRYSCTESGIGIGTALDDPPEDAEVSVGRPRGGVELAVLDESDSPVSPGEVGRVCLRSPAVMSGYWGDDAATEAAFTADGFVRTGDLGWVDEAGRLRLAGRTKEMYVRGGYNVYPMEVEGVLAAHPAVAQVCVVPRTDAVMGEVGVAFVVARPGLKAPSLEELRAFAARELADYKLPAELRVVAELPLTSMEKVDRRALTRLVGDGGP
jgi:acyl-CoA synthetase (AMP-forming)/AMP-acid ligase II